MFWRAVIRSTSVERRLDGLHPRVDGRLVEQSDVAVEAVIRHVEHAVLLAHHPEDALLAVEFGGDDGGPLWVLQLLHAAIGERHEVAVVLVVAAGNGGIEACPFGQERLDAAQRTIGNVAVVDDAYGIAHLARLHALLNLLHEALAEVVVHLGVAGELERPRLEVLALKTGEDEGQANAHYVVEVHDGGPPPPPRPLPTASTGRGKSA